MNNIETIDGITGEWRTVTKPSEVTVGQRVRYDSYLKFGYSYNEYEPDSERIVTNIRKDNFDTKQCKDLLSFHWEGGIQAFFPIDKPKRKVAKVSICSGVGFWFIIRNILGTDIHGHNVKSRKSALRGARRFCKAIGYEMEVVK